MVQLTQNRNDVLLQIIDCYRDMEAFHRVLFLVKCSAVLFITANFSGAARNPNAAILGEIAQ